MVICVRVRIPGEPETRDRKDRRGIHSVESRKRPPPVDNGDGGNGGNNKDNCNSTVRGSPCARSGLCWPRDYKRHVVAFALWVRKKNNHLPNQARPQVALALFCVAIENVTASRTPLEIVCVVNLLETVKCVNL